MDLNVVSQGVVDLVRLRGSLKLGSGVEELGSAFERAVLQGHHKFVVNMAEVPQMDSSGIGLLVRTHTDCVKHGGGIVLVQPSKFVVHTLQLVGVLRLFKAVENEAQALAVFGEPAGTPAVKA